MKLVPPGGLRQTVSLEKQMSVKVRHVLSGRLRQVSLCLFVLLDFSLTVKAATLILISGCGWAISSAKEGKSGFIYKLVNS